MTPRGLRKRRLTIFSPMSTIQYRKQATHRGPNPVSTPQSKYMSISKSEYSNSDTTAGAKILYRILATATPLETFSYGSKLYSARALLPKRRTVFLVNTAVIPAAMIPNALIFEIADKVESRACISDSKLCGMRLPQLPASNTMHPRSPAHRQSLR